MIAIKSNEYFSLAPLRCYSGSHGIPGYTQDCPPNYDVCIKQTKVGQSPAYMCFLNSSLYSTGFTASISNDLACQVFKAGTDDEYEFCVCKGDDCNNPSKSKRFL